MANKLTPAQLDKAAAKDALGSFLLLQSRDWRRRKLNEIWPKLDAEIDKAIANGDALDVAALVKQIFNERLELS